MDCLEAWQRFTRSAHETWTSAINCFRSVYDNYPQVRDPVDKILPLLLQYGDAVLLVGGLWVIWPKPILALAATVLSVFIAVYAENQGFNAPRFRPAPIERGPLGIAFLLSTWVLLPSVSAIWAGGMAGLWAFAQRETMGRRLKASQG